MQVRPPGPERRGPAEWFSGEVHISPITEGHGPHQLSLALVSFAAGARTAWHTHAIAQTLQVTAGEGRVQARGGQVATIREGDTVDIAAGEWHWHGAAPGHAMTHLSLSEGDTRWGEHVTDEEYGHS